MSGSPVGISTSGVSSPTVAILRSVGFIEASKSSFTVKLNSIVMVSFGKTVMVIPFMRSDKSFSTPFTNIVRALGSLICGSKSESVSCTKSSSLRTVPLLVMVSV